MSFLRCSKTNCERLSVCLKGRKWYVMRRFEGSSTLKKTTASKHRYNVSAHTHSQMGINPNKALALLLIDAQDWA